MSSEDEKIRDEINILDREFGSRIEEFGEQLPSKRPARERFEEFNERIPSGPLGKAGNGTLIGATGYLAKSSTNPLFTFLPGIRQPGFTIVSHSVESTSNPWDTFERHTFGITAVSRDVAEFVAKYFAAASNIDFATSDTELEDVELITERATYSTWRVSVLVDERGEIARD